MSPTVFSRYYLHDAMASSYVEGDQEGASSEHQANDTLWRGRADDGKVEYFPQQALVRALEVHIIVIRDKRR